MPETPSAHLPWLFVALGVTACATYSSALGFRSRQAALAHDLEAFEELMEEAADTTPAGPLDNPERTVLTHFLDLAGDPRFFEVVERWRSRGFVPEDMRCDIFRAHYRANVASNPAAAQRSADAALARAREAALSPDRSWEVSACLEEAPFLVSTATASLVPMLKMAADPSEPTPFRTGLLDGMTRVYLTSADRTEENEPAVSSDEARRFVESQAKAQAARIEWIVEAMRPHVDAPLLASATARGALEVENVSVPLGFSFVGRFASSTDPYEQDLAWAWVRSMKLKKKIPRIMGLGLWSRSREPKRDVFWYVCANPPDLAPVRKDDPAASLGPLRIAEGLSIRFDAPAADLEELRKTGCKDPDTGAGFARIFGPYPLEATAKAEAVAILSGEGGAGAPRTTIVLRRRLLK